MGHHLRARIKRKIVHRLQNVQAIASFLVAVFNSYRLAELLPLLPLVACLALLSAFPDWVLTRVDSGAEWVMSVLLGGKRARLRDASGSPTGEAVLYSIVGALDPTFELPDERLLCVPTNDKDRDLAFPSTAAAGWGNATFLALCMQLAYEDWRVVRDVVNHEWRHPSLYNNTSSASAPGHKRYLAPRFIQGCSFNFMQPAGSESSEELSHIHLDSDAVLLAVEDPARPAAAAAAVGSTSGGDGGAAGVAVILAFRGTEPLELADFQSDFDAVPEAGEWGCLHPGFLLALGLDPNLNPYHQTLTTYTALDGDAPAATVVAARPATPYEVLRDLILDYMKAHPQARLYVCGHSLGGALAVVFMGALMHDSTKRVKAIKSRVGALYTFGQPRVGDFEFLCHLQVSLLEPSKGNNISNNTNTNISTSTSSAAASRPAGSQGPDAAGGHHTEHAMTASGASKLRSLLKGQQQEDTAPRLTSRYIRVVNTFDIVPHIPPTLCNLYQHGGDLLYLQMTPGSIKFLTEQPVFFITGIFSSSVVKLVHYTRVLLGMQAWKGRDNYIRFGMRIGAVCLPFLIAGLNDHMPGDYCQSIVNSDPAAWQPFRPRKRLSRWANAVMFARALSTPLGSSSLPTSTTAGGGSAGAARASSGAAAGPRALLTQQSLSDRIQGYLATALDKAADSLAGPQVANGSTSGSGPPASTGPSGSSTAKAAGTATAGAVTAAAAAASAPAPAAAAARAGTAGGSSRKREPDVAAADNSQPGSGRGRCKEPDSAAVKQGQPSKAAAARAKLKGLTQRAVGHMRPGNGAQ